jgi:hypothetical protein
MADEATAARVLGAIRDTGGSHAERKRLTAIILKRASAAAREILEALRKPTSGKTTSSRATSRSASTKAARKAVKKERPRPRRRTS